MILLCFCLCVSLITGFSLTSLLLACHKRSYIHVLFQFSIATGLGFGVSSSLYFIHLFFGPSRARLAFMESALLLSLLFPYLFRTSANLTSLGPEEMPATDSSCQKMLLAGFFCTCILALIIFLVRSMILPHGDWDAWQTWNLFARFLYRGGNHWKDAFTSLLNPHHPDYPLLLPATIARCWQYMGKETQIVPVITAGFFTFATIGLLFSSLWLLKGSGQALLGGIVLAGTPDFVILGSMQYADVPLGFFFLAVLVLLSFQERLPENPKISLLAGMMAGFSCWTKNEGFLFLLSTAVAQVVSASTVASRKGYLRRSVYFLAGTAPVLSLVLFFKWSIAPANDIFSRQDFSQAFSKLTDITRYLLILKSFALTSLTKLPAALLIAFYLSYQKISLQQKFKTTFIILPVTIFLLLSGYFFVYVITPYDLDWHLETSFYRLLMQLWPSIIFTLFLMSRTPGEMLASTKNISPNE